MEENEASSDVGDDSEETNVVENHEERQRVMLARDYGEIARLAARFDDQIKEFVGNMNSMVKSIPAQDALAKTWDEHAKTNAQGTLKEQKELALDQDKIRGDEAKAFDTIRLL
jgi:hypothetical protein